MTTTPRTDAALPSAVVLRDSVLVDVSRALETELTASRAECERLREALEAVSVLGLQTDAYRTVMDFRDAVDDALALLKVSP